MLTETQTKPLLRHSHPDRTAYSVADVLRYAHKKHVAPLDAEVLLAHAIRKDRTFIMTHPDAAVVDRDFHAFRDSVERRAGGEPLAYIVGRKEFYGRDFTVSPDTLVPRPETELLVEQTLAHLDSVSGPDTRVLVADIGTGSGAIAVTLAAETFTRTTPAQTTFIATDIDYEALQIAQQNARHLTKAPITFLYGGLLSPLLPHLRIMSYGHVVLTANLPYVDESLREDLVKQTDSVGLRFEPDHALWAEEGGLKLYRQLFEQIIASNLFLETPVTVFCEINPDQAAPITDLARSILDNTKEVTVTVHNDLSNRARCVAITIA